MFNYFQSEATECGLVCVAIALDKAGAAIELSELRRKFPISSRGLSVKEIIDIAAAQSLVGRAVRCELDELSDLKTPAILHWDLNHFVVLDKVRGQTVTIHDPAMGKRQLAMDQVSRHFTGVAIELSPAPEFKKRKTKSALSLWSWFRLQPDLYQPLIQILLFSLLLQAYIVVSPFFIQLALDQAALKGDHDLLLTLALGFGLFALFNFGATLFRNLINLKLSALLNWDMSLRLFRHLLRLPLPWFQRRRLADVLSRFDAITPVRNLISGSLVATLIDGVLALLTLIMMLLFSAKLSLVVVIGLLCYVSLRAAVLPISIRLGMEALTARIAESSKRIESIRAIQTLKIMGAENQRESDWANKFAATIQRDLAHSKVDAFTSSSRSLIEAMVHLCLIYLGAKAIMDASMTVGLLYAFLAYAAQFTARSISLYDQYMNWRLTDMYSYRLADIVLTQKEAGIDNIATHRQEIKGELTFVNLAFSYAPQEPLIFQNISFSVKAGEYIAIIGPSGSGKSSLLKVLCGLYPPSYGEVLLDGQPLSHWGPKAVRNSLGVVMQDDELLTGTIAENVAFFEEKVDMDRVWSCLRIACLEEDVLKMPMKTETFLGDMGSSISGGQKQRLLLARALYRRPKILVLDEATSHLDMNRESQINKALKSLSITRIIVAHRKETIESADRIICLDQGRIIFDRNNLEVSDFATRNETRPVKESEVKKMDEEFEGVA